MYQMKLKYKIEIEIPSLKKANGLIAFDYLNDYSGIIKYVLKSDNKIESIKIEGIIEL